MRIVFPRVLCLCFLVLFLGYSQTFAQLQFVENKGQWDGRVKYKADIQTGAFFIEQKGFLVAQHNAEDLQHLLQQMHGHVDASTKAGNLANRVGPVRNDDVTRLRSHAYRVNFLNASKASLAQPDKALATYNNYFIGSDSTKWQGSCRIFQAVTFRDMYPNIDVRYYTDAGTLKYDIIVRPGGRIEDIVLQYEGVNKLEVRNKELVISTSIGETKELYPYTYQVQAGQRTTLDCKYVVKGNEVRFKGGIL